MFVIKIIAVGKAAAKNYLITRDFQRMENDKVYSKGIGQEKKNATTVYFDNKEVIKLTLEGTK